MRFPSIPWWAWLLLVLGTALALSALDVGFLSDDYLMVRYWDRGREAVQWQRVAADFAGPWSGVRDMYRPLVTLSIALQLSLHGFAPRLFHRKRHPENGVVSRKAAVLAIVDAFIRKIQRRKETNDIAEPLLCQLLGMAAEWFQKRCSGRRNQMRKVIQRRFWLAQRSLGLVRRGVE